MALADLDALKAVIANPDQILRQVKTPSISFGRSGKWATFWQNTLDNVGTVPTSAVAPDNTTAGAMAKANAGSGRQIILGGDYRIATNTTSNVATNNLFMIIDRLSHQGGLSANVNTAQTTNLPTAALTRYTSGVGVWMAMENYSAGGSTATVLNCSYTNTAGTSGHTGSLVLPTSSLNSITGGFEPIALQAGDLGVKSVESVTLTAATGTAGNFGITLFKPLAIIAAPSTTGRWDILSNPTWGEEVLDDACLQIIPFGQSNCTLTHSLVLAEV